MSCASHFTDPAAPMTDAVRLASTQRKASSESKGGRPHISPPCHPGTFALCLHALAWEGYDCAKTRRRRQKAESMDVEALGAETVLKYAWARRTIAPTV